MPGTIEAQKKTEAARLQVETDTRKRKNWGYIRASALSDWAETQNWETEEPPPDEVQVRKFFGTRLDARVEVFDDGTQDGKLFAVWRQLREPMEGEDPHFIANPPGPFIDLDLSLADDATANANATETRRRGKTIDVELEKEEESAPVLGTGEVVDLGDTEGSGDDPDPVAGGADG